MTKWKLLKSDNSAIDLNTQIGIINGFGVTAFASANVKRAGAPFKPEFTQIDTFAYLKLLMGHSARERSSILHNIG